MLQPTTLLYIIFGRVVVAIKYTSDAYIVGSLIIQSDDLDKIDIEWLGANKLHHFHHNLNLTKMCPRTSSTAGY
jgi:hypothetical protein